MWSALRAHWQRSQLPGRWQKAQQALQRGDPTAMTQLANEGLGDAWLALADHHSQQTGTAAAQQATAAYGQALKSLHWLNNRWPFAQQAYDERRLMGLGHVPDYAALAAEWESQYPPGNAVEVALAWIYFEGLAGGRNPQKAGYWLALAQARWGDYRAMPLPGTTVNTLANAVWQHLTPRQQTQLQEAAQAQAQAEFIAGK